MQRLLVVGLSGQVGQALLSALQARNQPVFGLSRTARPALPGVTWLQGSLEQMPALPDDLDCIISVGPLDAFADWLVQAQPLARRIIALGSTGRKDKQYSPDAGERHLAQLLQRAENLLTEAANRLGYGLTLLRPTLLYGSGRDRSLSRLIDVGRRWRWFPLPALANGLRQPVHVADVADAVLACLDRPGTAGQAYDLPGGETLPFSAMVRRTLLRHAPGCRVLRLPTPLFKLGFFVLRRLGRHPVTGGTIARLQHDQVVDLAPAREAFGFTPRRFDP